MSDLPDGFILDDPEPQAAPAQAAPQALPEGFAPDASGHPTTGPSGDFWTDVENRLATAGTDALNGVNEAIRPFRQAGRDALKASPPGVARASGADQPLPDPATARDQAFNTTGATEYVPETMPGRMLQSGLTAAVMAPLGGAATLREVAASAPSLAAGGATSEGARELFPNHPEAASLLGFLPGAWAAKTALNAPLSPASSSVDQPTAQLARSATQDYGIPLAPGQISGNPFVRYFYSETKKLPFSGAEGYEGTQQGAFNRAVSSTFGENADRITPEVLQNARDRIGGVMNDVASRTTINPQATGDLANKLAATEANARTVLTDQDYGPVGRQLDNVLNSVTPGNTISGEAYQALTRKGTPLDSALNSTNPNLRYWAGQIRGHLDDALEQSAAPEDMDALRNARAQYKALKTVQPLTLRADAVNGATPSTGDISPAALRGAVNQSYRNAAFAQPGDVPLNDLAKIGQRFLKEPSDSGTATRAAAHGLVEGAGKLGAAALGMGAMHEAGLPLLASAAGTAGGILVNRAAQAALRSPAIANRMINGSINPAGFNFAYPSLGQQAPFFSLPQPFGFAMPATSSNSR